MGSSRRADTYNFGKTICAASCRRVRETSRTRTPRTPLICVRAAAGEFGESVLHRIGGTTCAHGASTWGTRVESTFGKGRLDHPGPSTAPLNPAHPQLCPYQRWRHTTRGPRFRTYNCMWCSFLKGAPHAFISCKSTSGFPPGLLWPLGATVTPGTACGTHGIWNF